MPARPSSDPHDAHAGTGLVAATVVRGGAPALREVTLLAEDGEILVVLGPSGSGKSTLLRTLAGLEKPASGQVLIRGRDVTDLPPDARRVSMVFETAAVLPFLDVADNLSWGLRVRGYSREEIQERVTDRAGWLRLRRLLHRKPDTLSTGERSTVGIGRAVVSTPEAFLLDEPLAHLDAGQRSEVRRRIVDAVRAAGATTLYVTHDQTEGMAVADRIALLHQGRVLQLGRPGDLYRFPQNVIVASFLGHPPIGLVPATLTSRDGIAAYRIGERTVPLWSPVPAELAGQVGADVVLGVRANDVRDAASVGDDPDLVPLTGTVTAREYSGRDVVVSATVEASPLTGLHESVLAEMPFGTTLRALFPSDSTVRVGDSVQLAVDAARAHVFDARTGAALWHPDA